MTHLDPDLHLTTKRTRKREFLDEIGRVMQRSRLIALIEPHSPAAAVPNRDDVEIPSSATRCQMPDRL